MMGDDKPHQAVFFQDKHAGGFVKWSGRQTFPITAPSNRMHFSTVSRELSAFIVIPENLLHLLIVWGRHASLSFAVYLSLIFRYLLPPSVPEWQDIDY